MYKLMLELRDADEFSQCEARRAVEKVLAERDKIKGQIARDLRRLGGDFAFMNPICYSKLRDKYIRAHQSRKKLAILEQARKEYCRNDRHQT